MLRLTDWQAIKVLWLIVAATLPLFAIGELRLNIQALLMHIAIPAFGMGLVSLVGTIIFLARRGAIQRPLLAGRHSYVLLTLCFAFLSYHIFRMLPADDPGLAVREVTKLGLGFMCMLAVLVFFPRDRGFLELFWWVVIGSSAIFMAYLSFVSFVVYKSPYLTTSVFEDTSEGRDAFGQYVTCVGPYVFTCVLTTRRWQKILGIIFAVIMIAGCLYLGTRSAWVSIMAGLIYLIPVLWKAPRFRDLIVFLLITSVLLIVGKWALDNFVRGGELDYKRRLQYLYAPEEVSELNTYSQRMFQLKIGWNLFVASPFIGVGLTNTLSRGGDPHNSYMTILSDLGVIGELLFLGILVIVVMNIVKRPPVYFTGEIPWVSLGTRAAIIALLVSMLAVNLVHTTTIFWTLLGLALVMNEVERRIEYAMLEEMETSWEVEMRPESPFVRRYFT